MEGATILLDLIARAAKGEAAAAEAVITSLASGEPREQLSTLGVLNGAVDVAFWERALEYLATGTWAGDPLGARPDGARLWRAAQPKIRALFLARGLNQAVTRAREGALVSGIASGRAEVQRVAIDLAGASGNPCTVEPLLAALKTSRDRLQLEVVRALGQLGNAAATPALVEVLRGDDELAAALAKDALVAIGAPAVEPLTRVLDEPLASEQARWLAARGLARIADARAIPSLVTHLDDADYGVRWLAAETLSRLGAPALRAVLEGLATKKISAWRADSAAHVLENARPPAVKVIVQPVAEALRSVDWEWRTPTVADQALKDLDAKGLLA